MTRSIYLKAVAAILIYSVISKIIFTSSLIQKDLLVALLFPTVFGMIASCFFLYIFSHDDFLKFARAIEKKEEKTEKTWLHRLKHTGKILSTLVIGTVAGPILSALTVRVLLTHYKYKYILVILISIPSTIFAVGLAKGFLSVLH